MQWVVSQPMIFVPHSKMVIYIAPEPSLRGTLTIVLKCSVTQLFCAYTVLRTNVPASVWKGRGVLAVQTLVGCIWPELILWFALSQYFRAKKVRDRVNEVARALSLARVDAPRRSLWERLTSGSEQKTFTLVSLPAHLRHRQKT